MEVQTCHFTQYELRTTNQANDILCKLHTAGEDGLNFSPLYVYMLNIRVFGKEEVSCSRVHVRPLFNSIQ